MAEREIRSFEDLDAWKNCRAVKLRVCELVKSWPPEEKYRLIDQIIRSTRAPGSFLAEGFGRFYEKENIRYCRMAKGELYESKNHLWDALDEGYILPAEKVEVDEMIQRALQTINGYLRYLGSITKRYTTSEPPAGPPILPEDI